MSTELISLEEIYTKLKIKGYLKNITENSENKFSTTAIKTPKKISYLIEDEKYILKFLEGWLKKWKNSNMNMGQIKYKY